MEILQSHLGFLYKCGDILYIADACLLVDDGG